MNMKKRNIPFGYQWENRGHYSASDGKQNRD